MSQQIFDEEGRPINARCSISQTVEGWNIVVESRGGAKGSPNERNTDYSRGFSLLFERLAAIGASISTARVESRDLIRRGLSEADRRVISESLVYPIALTRNNCAHVVSELKRAQAFVGSERSKRGHNSTRRVLISVQIPETQVDQVPIADYITNSKATGSISDADLAEAIGVPLDAESIADARRWILAILVRRQGQRQFRSELLRAYGKRCAVTGCDAEPVLEAAHIVPYRGTETNVVGNGLLLRADIHTLFDRGMLGIDPSCWRIVLHTDLTGTSYGELDGVAMRLPKDQADIPHSEGLKCHLKASGLAD